MLTTLLLVGNQDTQKNHKEIFFIESKKKYQEIKYGAKRSTPKSYIKVFIQVKVINNNSLWAVSTLADLYLMSRTKLCV